MFLDFKGKNALVCGGSMGIGKATALQLAQAGCSVHVLARNESFLKETIAQLANENSKQHHSYLIADLQQTKNLSVKINELQSRVPGIDILINNSNGPMPKELLNGTADEFRAVFEQFFIANQLLVQAVAPYMKKSNYGRIINILGTSVKAPIPGLGLSVIKASVANWAKALSKELGPNGITVNNVLPGPTNTRELSKIVEILAKKEGIDKSEFVQNIKNDISLQRIAEPEEIANIVVFLASKKASYVTGTNISVDGGYTDIL